jgi:tetratricopeptide (TPR) repeat protein
MVAVEVAASCHLPRARRIARYGVALALSTGLGLSPTVPARATEPAYTAASTDATLAGATSTDAASAEATATASRRRAEEHHRRGLELYDDGALDRALDEFELAYSASHNHQVLFNIGQLHYRLGDAARARQALERFLLEGGERVPEARREEVARQLLELAPHTGPVIGAVDQRSPELGRPPPASPQGNRLPPKLVITWASAAVLTLGAAGTGIATYLSSRHYDQSLRASVHTSPESARDDLDRQRDRVQNLAFATDALIAAGLAAAGLALYMTLSDSPPGQPVSLARPGQPPIVVEF